MGFRALTVVVLLLGWALPARGQQSVTLQFNAGQVTLNVQNAPVRAILAEWARVGGATIVNGDRVAGPPVTLEITGVSEREALDIVLRSVAGYMLAPRRAGSPGASAFDRILILPTSSGPVGPPPVVAAAAPRRGLVTRPPGLGAVAPITAGQDDKDPAGDQEPAEASQSRTGQPLTPPFVTRPPIQPDTDSLDPDDAPRDATTPGAAGVAPTPSNPFGIPFGSSATPGVVTPAPRSQPQQQRPETNGVE